MRMGYSSTALLEGAPAMLPGKTVDLEGKEIEVAFTVHGAGSLPGDLLLLSQLCGVT